MTLSEVADELAASDRRADAALVRALQDGVEEFVREYVTQYPVPRVRGRKAIHLAPFGTQALRDYEVAILDTPLVQRLRQIRQTGFAFLTFPTS